MLESAPMADDNPITQLLHDWRAGNDKALNELMPLVHANLRQLANKYMRGENAGHTLQATALVNEAFLKLVDASVSWQSRAHFIAIAARAMRQVLIDHAKSKKRQKHGGNKVLITLHETIVGEDQQQPDLLDIEDALNKLAKVDARKAEIIELSFFGGMTYDEIAEALGISAATVDRELRFSRAWLQRELSGA